MPRVMVEPERETWVDNYLIAPFSVHAPGRQAIDKVLVIKHILIYPPQPVMQCQPLGSLIVKVGDKPVLTLPVAGLMNRYLAIVNGHGGAFFDRLPLQPIQIPIRQPWQLEWRGGELGRSEAIVVEIEGVQVREIC